MTTANEFHAGGRPGPRPGWSRWLLGLALVLGLSVRGDGVTEVRDLLRTGDYDQAISLAKQGLKEESRNEEWPLLLSRGLLAVGRYPEAYGVMTNALAKDSRSLRLRWLAREVFLDNGETNRAAETLEDIKLSVSTRTGGFRDAASMVVFAQAALALGADPKVVLEKILAPAQKLDPDLRDTYLARGEIALSKHDSALAAKAFDEGLKRHADDPDLLYGLAKAHADGDRELMGESLEAALKINPRHVPSLLLVADNRIDAEDYEGAAKLLDEVTAVNPWQPDAWAYRAVLAHLKNDPAAETAARESAQHFWKTNPRVYHLIGLKLSQKYRFSEGAARQRQALSYDADYLPAQAQLANDLLRLGEEAEGWRLAQEIFKKDGYDVAAYNLVTLHDTMAKYATLTNEHFILRISDHEAAVYGPRVLALLERARTTLCDKYGMELKLPTLVEVFAEQKDFGVRTFG
ncbi:MAG TPA: tetratricopeptide repeat protein, partial [Candidatus Limnocylindria bacterium]|nr:tetratricopeptide repeat protein [Candidatus Limnocylindria bacterium]